jgi:hypothetical protein
MYNQSVFHPNIATYVAVAGGAYNIPGAYGVIVKGTTFPIKGAIPVPTGKSGTIISTGVNVRGTNTKFLSELKQDDYLYHKDVVRRIKHIISDTLLVLAEVFPTDIATGEIPLVCESQYYVSITWKNTHATTSGIVQEAPCGPVDAPNGNGGAPISYDGSGGGTLEFVCQK